MKKLLLHVCCAPCLTTVWEQLKDEYDITLFWFNPNIFPEYEYEKRFTEFLRYAGIIKAKVINGDDFLANAVNFNKITEHYKYEPEGGKRCKLCIKYRLQATALKAEEEGFDFFATTLSVSSHKDSNMISEIGKEIEKKVDSSFLDRDFKKNDGYKRSIEICKEFNIYRQKYCGCRYSINPKS